MFPTPGCIARFEFRLGEMIPAPWEGYTRDARTPPVVISSHAKIPGLVLTPTDQYESRARVRTLKFILKHSKTMHDYRHAQHVTTRTHPTLEHQHQHSYPALPLPCVVRLSALRIASFNVGWVVREGEGALGIEPSSL